MQKHFPGPCFPLTWHEDTITQKPFPSPCCLLTWHEETISSGWPWANFKTAKKRQVETGIQMALSATALASFALVPVPTALSTVLLNMCLIGPSAQQAHIRYVYTIRLLCPSTGTHSSVHGLVEHVLDWPICRTRSRKMCLLCNMMHTV